MARKFWGTVLGTATLGVVSVAATPVAIINGVAEAASGRSFDDGVDEVYDSAERVANRAADFGDRYNRDLSRAAIRIGSSAAGAEIDHDIDTWHDHHDGADHSGDADPDADKPRRRR